MQEEPVTAQISIAQYLIKTGLQEQIILLGLGGVLTIIAVIALIFAKNRTLISGISFLTLIPGIIALISITADLETFFAFAVAQEPVKPKEFASVSGSIATAGFWGILLTIVPAGLCLAALLKTPSYIDEPPMD